VRIRRSNLALFAALCLSVAAGSVQVASAKQPPVAKATPDVVSASSAQLCAIAPSSALFAPWGDLNLYTPFDGSTFESDSAGWSTSGGAGIVNGDDDQLLSTAGTHAMQIPGGATATSPATCVDSTMPSMRFFIRRVSGTGDLTITGALADSKGNKDSAVLATVTGTTIWAPSDPVVFPSYLAALVGSGSLDAQFSFTANKGTTFRIDDVLMDPYRRT
jgi:hypothetical protein